MTIDKLIEILQNAKSHAGGNGKMKVEFWNGDNTILIEERYNRPFYIGDCINQTETHFALEVYNKPET